MIWSPDDVFSAGANLEALMPVFEVRRQGHRAGVEEVPGLRCCASLRPGAGRRRGARHRAGRRLRAGRVFGPARRGDGVLHGPRRGRRRPGARRRRPDLHRAPRGRDGGAGRRQRRHPEVPDRRLHQRGDGQGGDQRARVASSATFSTATSSCRTKTSCCTSRSPRPGRWPSGWRPPARRPIPVAGATPHRHHQGQLANMRDGGFISACTTSTSPADRRRGVRRRRRRRQRW